MNPGAEEYSSTQNRQLLRLGVFKSLLFRSLLPSLVFLLCGLFLIFLVGIAQKQGWISQAGGAGKAQTSAAAVGAMSEFTCPMHPQIRQPGQGSCPICGMPLVPATAQKSNQDEYAVDITPAQKRIADIKTEPARKEHVLRKIRTVGIIEIDETRQSTIASYVPGRLERLFADYTGVDVAKGDHLAVIYSPQLFSVQVELIEAKKTFSLMSANTLPAIRSVQEKLISNSRQKLIELGMTENQIQNLEKTGQPESRVTIFAPFGGTVIEKFIEEGKYIAAGAPIYRIANLSTIWMILHLFPEDAARIRFGQEVDATLTSLPGKTLIGRVAFIEPTVDPATRTVGVRVEFDNAEKQLRPGDYAQAEIMVPITPVGEVYDKNLAGKWISPMHPQIIRDQPGDCPICGMKLVPTSQYGFSTEPLDQPLSVTVPRSSVLMAGAHSVGYVETEPGHFEIRYLRLGPILRDKVIILEGVQEGEAIATSGNFLIDSQMQLEGKPSLIDPSRIIAKKPVRKLPLELETGHFTILSGTEGKALEGLYEGYFLIQKSLVADKLPEISVIRKMESDLKILNQSEVLSSDMNQLNSITKALQMKEEINLAEFRNQFKLISHAVLRMASRYRGESAQNSFHHFFCPMVKNGGGDWMQADETLFNPYFGEEMLTCGELVRALPLNSEAENGPEIKPMPLNSSPSSDDSKSSKNMIHRHEDRKGQELP